MELIYASLILFASIALWAFIKILQLSVAFKTVEELKASRLEIQRNLDLSIDTELHNLLKDYKPND